MSATHLWEPKHSYLCDVDHTERYGSWGEFIDEWRDFDRDYNLIVRWDWLTADESYEGHDVLCIYIVQQRKGRVVGCDISIAAEDETAAREWLTTAWAHLVALWAPVPEGG